MSRNPNLNNLGDLLRRNAVRYPDREGIISSTARLTWSEVNRRSNRLAHSLLDLGIRKGDRVAVVLNNTHQVIETMFAAFKVGAVYVPINFRLSPEEISTIVKDCDAVAIVYAQMFSPILQGIKSRPSSLKWHICIGKPIDGDIEYDRLQKDGADNEPAVEVGLDDLAVISYSGGTTGAPKGAMWVHRNILNVIPDCPYSYELAFKSKELIAVPSFAGGFNVQVLNGIYCATTLVFMDFDILGILQTIEKEKAELIALAANPLFMIANHPEASRYDLSSLKRINYGGGSMTLRQLEKIRSFFVCDIDQRYGSTETLLNITNLKTHDHVLNGDPEKTARLYSAGRANKGVDIRIVDEQGKEVSVGEIGEIATKSSGNMIGYWNNPELTKESLRDGWYYTKDIGYLDEEGYLFIVDRKNDMIKTGGLNVFPAEVEKVLAEHPGIAEAAVVSAPDPAWGERIVAVVVPREGIPLTAEDVIAYCRTRIGGFKVPKQVDFLSKPLPRNGLGKILRKHVREAYWKEQGKDKRVS